MLIPLDPSDAQIMQDADPALIWTVTHHHRWRAQPQNPDRSDGGTPHQALEADTLDELRAALPRGVQRYNYAANWPGEILEVWGG